MMKEKEKYNIELEQTYNKILGMPSLRDSRNIPCIIITPPQTANKEDCGIETKSSGNEPTDVLTPPLNYCPVPTTLTTLKNQCIFQVPSKKQTTTKTFFDRNDLSATK